MSAEQGGVIDVSGLGLTEDDLPMGGCATSRAHYAHLDAGDPTCENQR